MVQIKTSTSVYRQCGQLLNVGRAHEWTSLVATGTFKDVAHSDKHRTQLVHNTPLLSPHNKHTQKLFGALGVDLSFKSWERSEMRQDCAQSEREEPLLTGEKALFSFSLQHLFLPDLSFLPAPLLHSARLIPSSSDGAEVSCETCVCGSRRVSAPVCVRARVCMCVTRAQAVVTGD